jgi:RNA polymerase-interacting CarD/CdnL/TRCF family regulator
VKLGVGDLVVYGSHGAGRVIERKKENVVLEFSAGLSVTLPVDRAQEYLRPVATADVMKSVARTLREDAPKSEAVWLKRCKATKEKVNVGEAVGLAEVVRDCEGAPRLSPSERQLYLKARRLLADEIGLARGVESSEADEWIADQLGQTAPA